MNLLLCLIVLVIVLLVIQVGAIAFELTGVDSSISWFQSISCYTSTGFTTKEAEIVISTPKRRKIAMTLMILGHVGFVSLMATFVNTLRGGTRLPHILHNVPVHWVPWINVGIMIFFVMALYLLFYKTGIAKYLSRWFKEHIIKKSIVKPVTFEELAISDGGYGLCQVEVWEESPILGMKVGEVLKKFGDTKVLMLGKKGRAMHLAEPETTIEIGDKILCFGKMVLMRKKIHKEQVVSR